MNEPPQVRPVLLALLSGAAVVVAGVGGWVLVAPLNARLYPGWPWAAAITSLYVIALIAWLHGVGPPRANAAARRFHLRLWRPEPGAWSGENLIAIVGLIALHLALTALWILTSTEKPIADLSPYPTTAFRISVLVMGAAVSGVVEEVAFRGIIQSQLERFGNSFAIVVTSIAFVFLHITHGFAAMLALAPAAFIASVIYGVLAQRSGSIVPGAILHTLGDGAYTVFVMLGGDISLLVVK